MKTTMDSAGRIVIPKSLRQKIGLKPGPIELHEDGAGIRVEPVTNDSTKKVGRLLIVPASGEKITDDLVRELRLLA